MIDVHLPHGKLVGVKDFLLHLFTITIGLLIALSLEGLVEYQHHRHLAQEAEGSLRDEIAANAHIIGRRRQQIKHDQMQAEINLKTLAEMEADPKAEHGPIRLAGEFGTFDDQSWKTAQTTGAVAYMPYKDAVSFSDIYLMQTRLDQIDTQLHEEMTNSLSLFLSHPNSDWVPNSAQIDLETDRIGRMQGRLSELSRGVDQLDETYRKFESEHK